MKRNLLVFLIIMFIVGLLPAQSCFTKYEHCHFQIELPYFVNLIDANVKSPVDPWNCVHIATIPRYGYLLIVTTPNNKDPFNGDKEAMFRSLRSDTTIRFDDGRSGLNDNGFEIYSEYGDKETLMYMLFIYNKTHRASLQFIYPRAETNKLQPYINLLSKTFKVI